MTTKAAILQTIRHKCLDCSGHQRGEVRLCPVTNCDLWRFRLGRDPAPGEARGCAKPALARGDCDQRIVVPVPESHPATGSPESVLQRDGYERGDPSQRQGSVGNRAPAQPVRLRG